MQSLGRKLEAEQRITMRAGLGYVPCLSAAFMAPPISGTQASLTLLRCGLVQKTLLDSYCSFSAPRNLAFAKLSPVRMQIETLLYRYEIWASALSIIQYKSVLEIYCIHASVL